MADASADLITQGVLREGLSSIVREMRGLMIRSSYSSIIYEGFDFSCAMLDASGRLVAQSSEDHPFHVIPVAWTVQHLLRRLEREGTSIGPDDIFLHNDPYTGGTHLNDVAVIWPVFREGRLTMFVVVRSHWADIGGMTPGSLSGNAAEILQEGLRLDCVRADKAGGGPILNVIRDNVRVSEEAMADFRVVLGTCRVAESRLDGLYGKYGLATVNAAIDGMLDASETRMKARIADLADGTYHGVGYLDGNDPALFPLSVHVAMTVDGDTIHADFKGTSPQVAAPLNAGPAIAATSILTILKSFLDPAGLINDGTMRPITVDAPEGTIVHASWPAPCGGLNEVRFASDAAVMSALSFLVPEKMTGDVRGTSNHTYIGGRDDSGRPFIFYEYPSGGTGGFDGHDGNPAVRAFNEGENVSIQSAEVVETVFPLKLRRNELRPDSGGAGRWRGGMGLLREVEVMTDEARLSLLSDRNFVWPAGVNGGRSGAGNHTNVCRDGAPVEPSSFRGKISGFPLKRGDLVVMRSSGGGGFGDPAERDAEALSADKDDGIVTEAGAAAYRDQAPDETVAPIHAGCETLAPYEARLSAALAERLGTAPGQMIEIVPNKGAVLRFWVRPEPASGHDLVIAKTWADRISRSLCKVRTTPTGTPEFVKERQD
ncbi:MAG: hydantoinase B/oxoprolinase family protein [Pseudomonadota bacterium]